MWRSAKEKKRKRDGFPISITMSKIKEPSREQSGVNAAREESTVFDEQENFRLE